MHNPTRNPSAFPGTRIVRVLKAGRPLHWRGRYYTMMGKVKSNCDGVKYAGLPMELIGIARV